MPEAPSRAALVAAEGQVAESGHEHRGFLSEPCGFLPRLPVVEAFPPSHSAWDAIVRDMPDLWRTVSVRTALDSLPVLRATPEHLADGFVRRAAVALGVFAHSYVRSDLRPAGDLPIAVLQPWGEVCERLGRPQPHLAYDDLVVSNHRLRRPELPEPHRVENMDLLVPTVDNQEERVFYLTQVEILARTAPAVGAVVRAQEAALGHEHEALATELLFLLDVWRSVAEKTLHKIDPNRASATHVDPVIWAKTVAPLAGPLAEGTPNPSGTSAPIFHLMDAFFGRRFHESTLGREVAQRRQALPAHQRAFLEAVDQVPVPDYVARSGDSTLRGLLEALFDAYAGEKGCLGVHRTKVYGYLATAFKVGHAVTGTGFRGAFVDRSWMKVDHELESTRTERYRDRPPHVQYATVTGRAPLGAGGHAARVVLDVTGAGVVYRPGDRCGILPENGPEMVERSLLALRASGDEPVGLTRRWQEATRYRSGYEGGVRQLPLATFLRFAKLRPLLRSVGKDLLALTASPQLHRILEARAEDQWELWDVLLVLAGDGFDTHRLVEAGPWRREALARLVPPEDFRMYSVSSAPSEGSDRPACELHLSVAELRYVAEAGSGGASVRHGTASRYLVEPPADGGVQHVSLRVVRPTRFGLPSDGARPVVMFAGGIGISPFRGFIAERLRDESSGDNWLFVGTRTHEELYFRDEIEQAARLGKLHVRVALSREDAAVSSVPGAVRGHVGDALLRDPVAAAQVWSMLRSPPEGEGGYFYVCGQPGFAASVMTALTDLAERSLEGPPGVRAEAGRSVLRRVVAERRYLQDIFTSRSRHTAPGILGSGWYGASDVCLHNDADHGYWTVINGSVYDLTEFRHLHPGGERILREVAGVDASRDYRAVGHEASSEVHAMLGMYKIGQIRRLQFGDGGGTALIPGSGAVYVSLPDLYRRWVRFLYLLAEMENALANDYAFLDRSLTRDDDPASETPLRVQYAIDTHQRFLGDYYAAAVGDDLRRLWAATVGLCAPARRIDDLHRRIRAAEERVAGRDEGLVGFCRSFEHDDRRFLGEMKLAVREGVVVFETLEAETLARGGDQLVAALDEVPATVERYQAAVAST